MREPSRLGARAACLVAGIALGQAALFGASLAGQKILLPLELLASPRIYLPATPEWSGLAARDPVLSDAVFTLEPWRRFAAREVRAGRLPLWNPYNFAGAPFAGFARYSPYALLDYVFPDPRTLAWSQLLEALVAGAGAHLFFRIALGVAFWPAAVGAWCLPLTGVFGLWQAYPTTQVLSFYPWILLGVDAAVRRPAGLGPPLLAGATALALLAGQLDVAALALLYAGLYAVYRLAAALRGGAWPLAAAAALLGAVLVGAALAAPYWLPLVDYARTGERMQRRAAGAEERPPTGMHALPEVVLPEAFGSTRRGSQRLIGNSALEGAPAAYAGLLAALVLAPLAWASRAHRGANLFWLGSGLLALGWILAIPGLVAWLRAPPLNLLSHNRAAFAAGFAILASAVVGLDALARGLVARRAALALPALAVAALGAWSLARWLDPPSPAPDVARAQLAGAIVCAVALAAWGALLAPRRAPRALAPLLAAALLAELGYWARANVSQADPRLYYPDLPVLERLAVAPPGRVLGVLCLPPSLLLARGLADVRGYDGVDPARMIDLLALAEGPQSRSFPYARAQFYVPRMEIEAPSTVRLPPVLDLLGVHYLVFRGEPPAELKPLFAGGDYFALENTRALPRAFVPRRVRSVSDPKQRLALLGAADFDPRELALVEEPLEVPDGASGQVRIAEEEPARIVLEAELERPGLVVLADAWDAGWRAERDGQPVPIHVADHALRGIEAPAGKSRIELRYAPALPGIALAAAAGALLAAWLARALRRGRSR